MIGPGGISCAIEAMIASSVLMVLVLVLRTPVRRAFGANVAYALWALPVLRLVLPPLPAAWTEATRNAVSQATAVPMHLAAHPVELLLNAPGTQVDSAAGNPWIVPAIAALWLIGAGGFFAWHVVSHRRFCARMLAGVGQSAELDGVCVIESDAASGPLAFGVVRRYVAFPRDFAERYEPEERDLALAHELGHHARGDLIANWIALGVLAVHWFNPIAWRAFRAFRADQEIANDARVLAGMNPMRRHVYACAIVKAAHPASYGEVAATCHLNTIDDLKRRLRMLTTRRTSKIQLVSGGAMIAALTLGGLGLTASGSAAAERVRSGVERATGVDIAALAPPADISGDDRVPPVPPIAETPEVPEPAMAIAPVAAVPATVPETPDAWSAPRAPEPPLPPEVAEGRRGTTVITVDKDGKRNVRHGRYVKLGPNGEARLIAEDGTITYVAGVPEVPQVPEVRSKACGTRDDVHRTTIEDQHDGRRRITVCTDRVAAAQARGAAAAARGAAAAARGAQLAMNGEQMQQRAYRHALDGLRAARAQMRLNRDMSADARRGALDGINTAIAELASNIARGQ
jgi:bla regulator protein BlaR1